MSRITERVVLLQPEEIMDNLINALKGTSEYNQYHNLLEHIKSQPELYNRISEYRRRSLAMQMSDSENFIHENNKLQKEYYDLQNNALSNEFFSAEHQYCVMVRNLQNKFLEGTGIETDFLEG
ncbi:MAG: YlbF family regulator [Lachnospiraceae bacterium]|nr:YlbF family regulator [Lachnospiraceae bacterium]